ncbi:MAG TPA: PadR family transcriptional regulator [Lactobacillus sp.]|nr:PadR family transcriptional regulator [Lactobacillus sp.]
MKSRQVVLGILKRGPQTGYDITQMFQTSFTFFFDSSAGMVYPALRRLEQDGCVTKTVVPQEGKPNKNVYEITQAGLDEFADYLKSPVEPEIKKSDFLARLMFGEYVEPAQIVKIIKDEVEFQKQESEVIKARLEEFSPGHTAVSSTQELAYQYGLTANISKIEFFEKWLKDHPDGV